jgi:SanA protein
MLVKILLLLAGLAVLVLLSARLLTGTQARALVFSRNDVPARRVVIVFGAGLWRDGSATPVLEDRVSTAADLYHAGKVEILLMSGDNRFIDYNEPAVMRELAMGLGVPDEAIVLDFAGRRTHDTCYRAREIFLVEEAILVTQAFHMPRALYLCNQLGVDAVGVEAQGHAYRRSTMLYWNLRELLATTNAVWEVHVSHPVPVLGKQEPIFKEPQP